MAFELRVLIIPLCVTIGIPKLKASVGTRGLYEMVGQCPEEKVILIDSSWDLGSKPECMAQLECFVKDLCKRKKKFVVFSTGLYAPTFAQQVILIAGRRRFAGPAICDGLVVFPVTPFVPRRRMADRLGRQFHS